MFPPVFLAQCANTLAFLATGAMAMAVARRMEDAPLKHRECWRLMGSAFLLFGVVSALSDVAGGWALVEGPESGIWKTFLRFSPGFNYATNLTLYAFCTLLVVACLRREKAGPLPGRTVWGVLVLSVAAGMGIGMLEGSFMIERHLSNFVLLNTGLLLLLMSALSVAVMTGSADRLFALALAAYTGAYPMTTLWLSWRAHASPGRMTPPVLYTQLYFIAFVLVTLGVATYRWMLARRGV
ncbi:MAG TPA: hypothetical protein VFR81_09955, partial [Longimicrobium sp.]|nr:hypothetical protein [Longimicrobium sp.]